MVESTVHQNFGCGIRILRLWNPEFSSGNPESLNLLGLNYYRVLERWGDGWGEREGGRGRESDFSIFPTLILEAMAMNFSQTFLWTNSMRS